MRILLTVREPRLPMQDTEMASRMIRLFGRMPRPNRRRAQRPECWVLSVESIGGLALWVVGIVLAVLLFTFQ